MTTHYLIIVNGIQFAEPVEQYRRDYILQRLANFPELTVKVIGVQVDEVMPA